MPDPSTRRSTRSAHYCRFLAGAGLRYAAIAPRLRIQALSQACLLRSCLRSTERHEYAPRRTARDRPLKQASDVKAANYWPGKKAGPFGWRTSLLRRAEDRALYSTRRWTKNGITSSPHPSSWRPWTLHRPSSWHRETSHRPSSWCRETSHCPSSWNRGTLHRHSSWYRATSCLARKQQGQTLLPAG